MSTMTGNKITYLNTLKLVLTILVVVLHSAVTYGSEGGWYYQEPTDDLAAIIPLTLVSAVLQSFFMSLLFFISAYFTPGSVDRKGVGKYSFSRLVRLGIPCLLFYFGIGPLTDFALSRLLEPFDYQYRLSWHIGPLWFALALLIFTGAYIVYRLFKRAVFKSQAREPRSIKAPTTRGLVLLVGSMAALTFLARWAYPVGTGILGMQLGSFPQYIMMFVLGLLAYRNNWLESLHRVRTKPLLIGIVVLILILPVLMFIGADAEHGFDFFLGGPYWQSAAFSAWESIMCIGMSLLLLSVFSRKRTAQSKLAEAMSGSAYTVYVIHSVVLVLLSFVLLGLNAHPLVKFAVLATCGTATSFLIAKPIRSLPLLRHVL